MVRIDGKAFWLFLPALADVLIGGEPFQRFEPLREIIGHEKRVQMCFQVIMSRVVIFFHGGFFERAVHAFHLAIGPGMVGFGQPMVDARLLADAVKDVEECVLIALPVRELNAVIGQHGVDLVGHGADQVTQDLCGYGLVGVCMPLGRGQLADTIDGDNQRALAFCRADLRDGDRAVAEGIGLERFLRRRIACHVRQAADAMPLQAVMPRGSGQVRPRGWQGRQAIVQREQRMLAKSHDQRLFGRREDGGARLLRAHRRIVPMCPLLPRRHRFRIQGIPLRKPRDALLTLLDRSMYCLCRAGASV